MTHFFNLHSTDRSSWRFYHHFPVDRYWDIITQALRSFTLIIHMSILPFNAEQQVGLKNCH